MRRTWVLLGSLSLVVAACNGETAPADDAGTGSSSGAGSSGSSGTGSSGSTSSSGSSGSPKDSGPTPNDGSADDGASEDAASDATSDASTDASADATADASDAASDAADAGSPTNYATLGVATATSNYPDYPASQVNDGVATTSWYAAQGSCSNTGGGAIYVCAATNIEVAFASVHTIGRVRLLGNRDIYPEGYDVLTARIELVGTNGAVLYSADVTTSRGAEPNGDVEHVVTPAKANVKKVRVVLLTGEASSSGLAEIEAYAY
jgi:hypothetical protein